MPRGASASGSGGGGGGPSFRIAEHSLHMMSQVKSYFSVGMDHVLEVATDMAEYGKDDEAQAKQLRKIMLNYIQMERDMDDFMKAASDVIAQGGDCEEEGGLVQKLEREVKELSQHHNQHSLKQHDKYTELEQKIWDSQHPDALPNSMRGVGEGEEDVEMTQEEVNTRCPYTGLEMVDPVRNVHCKHTYDRAGILQHIKQRGNRAMCPVGGCKNNKAITDKDLEDHKEMRRYINNKKKRPNPTASTSGASQEPRTSRNAAAKK